MEKEDEDENEEQEGWDWWGGGRRQWKLGVECLVSVKESFFVLLFVRYLRVNGDKQG